MLLMFFGGGAAAAAAAVGVGVRRLSSPASPGRMAPMLQSSSSRRCGVVCFGGGGGGVAVNVNIVYVDVSSSYIGSLPKSS